MYTKIVNPKTHRRVLIKSKLGKRILRNYLNVLSGGAYAGAHLDEEEDSFLDPDEFEEANLTTASGAEGEPSSAASKHTSDSSDPLVFDDQDVVRDYEVPLDCNANKHHTFHKGEWRFAPSAPIAKGGYKIIYKPKCTKLLNKNPTPLAKAPGSDPTKCKNSILSLIPGYNPVGGVMSPDYVNFLRENKYQKHFKGPVIHRFGACNGKSDEVMAYKLEEKYAMDLASYMRRDWMYVDKRAKRALLDNIKHSLKKLLTQIATIHYSGFGHYDIKLQNVLVNTQTLEGDSGLIKDIQIIDFGLVNSALWGAYNTEALAENLEGRDQSTFLETPGTPGYKDPVAMDPTHWYDPQDREKVMKSRLDHQKNKIIGLNYQSDIWALGKLILFLFHGIVYHDYSSLLTSPLPTNILKQCPGYVDDETVLDWGNRVLWLDDMRREQRNPFGHFNDVNDTYQEDLTDLLFNMLHINQKKRYTINQVLDHNFFKDAEPNLEDRVNRFREITQTDDETAARWVNEIPSDADPLYVDEAIRVYLQAEAVKAFPPPVIVTQSPCVSCGDNSERAPGPYCHVCSKPHS